VFARFLFLANLEEKKTEEKKTEEKKTEEKKTEEKKKEEKKTKERKKDVFTLGDVANSLMTMSLTEGLIRSLDPEFDMVTESYPYFMRYRGADITSAFRSVCRI